jgi:hypothetical protein
MMMMMMMKGRNTLIFFFSTLFQSLRGRQKSTDATGSPTLYAACVCYKLRLKDEDEQQQKTIGVDPTIRKCIESLTDKYH